MSVIIGLVLAVAIIAAGPARRLPKPRQQRQISRRKLPTLPKRHDIDLGVLASEVATRLRAGMGVEKAWQVSLERTGLPVRQPVLDRRGTPRILTELDRQSGPADRVRAFLTGAPRITHVTRIALPSLLAATRLTWETGAPMADVLDECAEGLTEAGEAQAAREIALRGPHSTATMLAWLPIIGIGLGFMMGVDPVGFLLGSTLGRVFLILGICFEIAGVIIVRRLVRTAQTDGAIGRQP